MKLLSLLLMILALVQFFPAVSFLYCVTGHDRSLNAHWSVILTDDNSFRPHPWGALMRHQGLAFGGINSFFSLGRSTAADKAD